MQQRGFDMSNELEAVDRADGCKGSFCVRRIHEKGYAEYWDARSMQFCSIATVMSEDSALKLIKKLKLIHKLKTELSELLDKYNKLDEFIDGDSFYDLAPYLRGKMIDQHTAMLNYKWALINRIEYMEDDK